MSETPPEAVATTSQISASDIAAQVIKMTDNEKAKLV